MRNSHTTAATLMVLLLASCGTSAPDAFQSPPPVESPTTELPATEKPESPIGGDDLPDIGLLPEQDYRRLECPRVEQTLRSAGDTHPFINYVPFGPGVFKTRSDIVAQGFVTVLVRVEEVVGSGVFVPTDVDGLFEGDEAAAEAIAPPFTAVRVAVLERATNADGVADSIIVSDLGCLQPGVVASTTPGATLLMILRPLPPGTGPEGVFAASFRVHDWFEVLPDGSLGPRVGILGTPSNAEFLLGTNAAESIDALARVEVRDIGDPNNPDAGLYEIPPAPNLESDVDETEPGN